MRRNPEIDIVKGIAIGLVVLGHLLDLIGDAAPAINLCHIAAFFFVSGFLLPGSLERHGAGTVLRSKAKGLLIPYLCWSGVSLAANLALAALRGGGLTPAVLMAEFTDIFLRARSVWFLLQLLFAHCVFLACRRVAGEAKAFCAVNLAAYALIYALLPDDWFQFILFKRLYGFFLAGYAFAAVPALGKARATPQFRRVLVGAACAYPALVWAFYRSGLYTRMVESSRDPIPVALGMLIGAAGVALIGVAAGLIKGRRVGGALAIVGQYSIDIYVIHMFPVKFLPVQSLTARLPGTLIYVALILYAAAIVAGCCLLASKVFRRFRLYRMSVGR